MAAHPNASFATRALHADDSTKLKEASIAPSISVSTTFRRAELPEGADPSFIGEGGFNNPDWHIYSRYTQPTTTRVEAVLSSLLNGHAIVYSSGLGAAFAALLHLQPTVVAITGGYHGCHHTIELYGRGRQGFRVIGLDDDYPEGTLCWLETPLNPTGEARDIEKYAKKAHAAGGKLFVDATFGPPPLQDPFKWGADMVMHSATKYFAGHSDALVGVLAVRTDEEWQRLWSDRTFSGSTPGSLESWLLLRSLRTLSVRVEKQARTATQLAQWLQKIVRAKDDEQRDGVPSGVIERVHHASLQEGWPPLEGPDPQLKDGPATFAVLVSSKVRAQTKLNRSRRPVKALPSHIAVRSSPYVPSALSRVSRSQNATSLGGVESLLEQRKVSDEGADPRLRALPSDRGADPPSVRLSIGLEDLVDLQADLRQAFIAVKDL